MSFKNKVVLVTGASSGIGAAAAEAFSSEGAQVVMVGRNETKLSAVASKCNKPFVIRADVADDDDARRIIDDTIKKFGKLDVLVNNAGMGSNTATLLEGDIMKDYDNLMSVNLRAVVHLTKLAAPHLIKTKGNIVNISSIAGTLTPVIPTTIIYYVTKAGLNHFSACAALELGREGVRVNTVSPGPVQTDFFTNSKYELQHSFIKKNTILNRISESEEIADLVLFLASDKAKGITASNFVSDNGAIACRN
ncbi:3-dehydroecdysone 3alpha-reductase [Danaus plexippus plexippus]|uniref:3-dehydroecdysone 3alpha-reductase n=1 Tax=Danaus plexippus plexippus TaxID=278856 RepID=A0A212F250_DANPL|nr:3-dehydroecdysone 3alpha-reductase [Danaus plexippus plexippus]